MQLIAVSFSRKSFICTHFHHITCHYLWHHSKWNYILITKAPPTYCVPLNQVPFPSQPDSGNLLQPDSPVVFTAGFVYITFPLSLAETGLERKRSDWCNNGHLQYPSPAQNFHISEIYCWFPSLARLIRSGPYVTFAPG